jgi:uncharacterized membrane protein YhhN
MRKIFFIVFFILLAAELTGIQLNNDTLQFICKPLLIPVLLTGFVIQAKLFKHSLKKWLLCALFFSWLGDVLLLFQERRPVFFLLGLAAFLIAHIFYIVLFHNIRLRQKVKSSIWLLLIVVVYYAVLITILSPYLGNMKLPVRIYGIIISFMFMLAMHMLYISNKKAGRLMMFGALLFIISDSILAVNKFYSSFNYAGILIMFTYALAQLFIVMGVMDYISSSKSK